MSKQITYTKNLPHILPAGAIYFVTFRLYGSIPFAKLNDLKVKFEFEKSNSKSDEERNFLSQQYYQNKDKLLEQIDNGPQYLTNPFVSSILKEQMHKHDNCYYDLMCYCIMSNHVHILLDTSIQLNSEKAYVPLFKILKQIKGASSYLANKLLNRTGTFWIDESYDHYIRTDEELANIQSYILENPVKAKLVLGWRDWPNTFCKYPPD